MRSGRYVRALLALSLSGCGARTSLDFADEYGAGGASAGNPSLPGGAGGSSGSAAYGGSEPAGGTAGAFAGAGAGGAHQAGAGGSAGSSAGFGGVGGSTACMPSGPERCDGVDNDCNGVVDDLNVCPCDPFGLDDRKYLFCRSIANWADAQSFCARFGYHLTSIRSASEDHWLEQTVASLGNSKWWIGLNDIGKKGRWQWLDGTPYGYQHWGAGEPNDAGGMEDCVQLNRFGVDGGWNDEPCDGALPFVCESPAF
jgi:hypothetical protein